MMEAMRRWRSVQDIKIEETLKGDEAYEVYALSELSLLSKEDVAHLIYDMRGLLVGASCLEKAVFVCQHLQRAKKTNHVIQMGSVLVTWPDQFGGCTQYGHSFNPPFEFHAWVKVHGGWKRGIIDVAMPGLILRGQEFSDAQGPFLQGMIPKIIAGLIPPWVLYKKEIEVDEQEARRMVGWV